ncbi:threonine--tRNA ligase [Peredibacter starrii]|uniref:Threonine--tRNA ligase n=1 Tax=Peredibacter starrii TaxID=28202 RepID=A0AAX4HSY0_9BACT|nr:threonine--tRNA ligase [Peredibacter starrii]WPU66312.1 threonine--tRNA ligase [Peredibacter starrii]
MAKYDLDTLRHSTAHLMAQAIMELYPNDKVQLGIGPTIENGFYYDIDMAKKLADEDLKTIEEKMKEIIKRNLPVVRHEVSRDEAMKLFADRGQTLKTELIRDIPEGEVISYYTQGDTFFDLCTGPHVEKTSDLTFYFKLLHTAGAYWRGDQTRPMLQRIYAACFSSKEELRDYLTQLEEAKKRDHRKLGKELELFIFDPVAPASPFFMPKGALVYNGLVEFMRRIYNKFDYQEVITPQVLDVDLWHTSGHYEKYHENMYFTQIDEREFALKPMNCPCHMLMFSHHRYSYRDLPLRFADFGRLHRYEKSGVVAGLTRVRTFCQDDAHIFIQFDGIQEEIKTLMKMFFIGYEHFGFKKIKIGLSTRPEMRVGSDETWDKAEAALKAALDASGKEYFVNEGDGAFYGPKIDIQVADALGRYFQLGTIQLDFQLPDRFDLKFQNASGEMERPVVIHRALLGSLERFIGVYLEHVGGAFPFWLSPEQAVIVPVKNELHLEAANALAKQLKQKGFRVRVDDRNESMGLKTRQAQTGKIPFMLVMGDKEIEDKAVAVRKYGEQKSEVMAQTALMNLFETLDLEKVPAALREV